MPKKITIEDLAKMVNEGFKATASKEDLTSVKEDVRRVEQIQKDTLEEMTAMHGDVRYLKSSVSILIRNEAERDSVVKDLVARVRRLEQKASLAR